MGLIPLNITPCFCFEEIELDHNKVLDELKKIPYHNTKQSTFTFNLPQKGMYISENQTNIFKDIDSGKTILNVINNYVGKVIKNIYEYDVDFKITTNWATKAEPNCIGEYHNHANFWLTGCYYPEGTEEEKLYICFKKNFSHFQPKVKKYNNLNSKIIEIIIKKGLLLIFPAEIEHRIGYNSLKRDRYSIAFNVLPKGKMGLGDGEYNF